MNQWINVNERLPECEKEVLVVAKRGRTMIITTAIYEDGTMPTCESDWCWYDLDEVYDEENDVYLVPIGWWEYRHYNDGEIYNLAIDDEILCWMPLPELPDETI